jgi:hypothetical protein
MGAPVTVETRDNHRPQGILAAALAIQTSATPVHAKDDIEGIIAILARDPGGGLIVMPDIFNVTNRDLIIALVPAIYFTAAYFAKSAD